MPFDCIAIVISTGGTQALSRSLPEMCRIVDVPILLVQHMPAGTTSMMVRRLDKACSDYRVKEAEHREPIVDRTAYVAPGDWHMEVVRCPATGCRMTVHQGPKENQRRPSGNIMMRSAAKAYGSRIIGVVMTGMGDDGTIGLGYLKRAGAHTIAQDEASSAVWGMPARAIAAGVVDVVLSLEDIAAYVEHVSRTTGKAPARC